MKTTAKERGILFSAAMIRALLDGRKTMTRRVVNLKSRVFTFPHIVYKSAWEHPGGGWTFSDVTKKPDDWQPQCASGVRCPYGEVGDRLWVRETWCSPSKNIVGYKADAECGAWMGDGAGGRIWNHHGVIIESPAYLDRFANDQRRTTYSLKKYGGKWRPSIHMFRWASRITLEVTAVKVERLQSISAADAMAEGITIPTTSFEENKRRLKEARELAGGFDTGNCKYAVVVFKELWESIHGKGSWSANPWLWCISFRRVDEAGRGKQNEGRGE